MAETSCSPATSASLAAWPHATTRRCPHRCGAAVGGAFGLLPDRALRGRARQAAALRPAWPSSACRTPSGRGSATSRTPIRDALLDGRARRLGHRGLPRHLEALGGRAAARPSARPEPPHLPAGRPAGEGGPDEHGPRPGGPVSVPRRRPARLHHPPAARAQGSRAVAEARPQGRREGPGAGRDPGPAEEGLRRARWIVGFGRICERTSAARSALPTPGSRRTWSRTPSTA